MVGGGKKWLLEKKLIMTVQGEEANEKIAQKNGVNSLIVFWGF